MWRNYGDVTDSWNSVTDIMHYYGNNPQNFSAFTGPGGWADPDMVSTDQWICWFLCGADAIKNQPHLVTLCFDCSVNCVVQLLAESVCVEGFVFLHGTALFICCTFTIFKSDMTINAFLMLWSHLWLLPCICETQSTIHETVRQYTT